MDPFQHSFMDLSDICYDSLMCKAYRSSLSQPVSGDYDSAWCSRWRQVIYHSGNHYVLPGGSIGQHYVDILAEELTHLAEGHYPSELFLFSVLSCCSLTVW